MDDKEFLKTYTGYIPGSLNATISPLINPRRGRLATPESWSWLDKPNAVGPVTNQGGCGSCTIFATIGVIESHMRILYGIDTKLSEQEAMQCCGGCGGGTNSYIYAYAKNGGTYESDFKYAGKVLEPCNTNRSRVPASKVESYYRIAAGADAVKNGMWHLVNVGPLATGLCLPGRSFQSYSSGVYDDEDWTNCGWHAVMVVGFGTENGKPYWLVRNSWGK